METTKNGKEAEEKEGEKDEIRRQVWRAIRTKNTESRDRDRRANTSGAYLSEMRKTVCEENRDGNMEMHKMRLYVYRRNLCSTYTIRDNRAADD